MKKYFLEVLVCINTILILTTMGFIIYYNFYKESSYSIEEDIMQPNEIDVEEVNIVKQIAVEIKGAVANPGVYHLDENLLIDDLVSMAGGLNTNAYTNNINFSKELKNEMVVYVYTNYEYNNLNKKEVEIQTCSCPKVDITPCLDTGASVILSEDKSQEENTSPVNENHLVNINTATVDELTTLNGIGESKAKSIIEYRQNNGNFTSIEDIKKVTGISESTYEKIKDYITV